MKNGHHVVTVLVHIELDLHLIGLPVILGECFVLLFLLQNVSLEIALKVVVRQKGLVVESLSLLELVVHQVLHFVIEVHLLLILLLDRPENGLVDRPLQFQVVVFCLQPKLFLKDLVDFASAFIHLEIHIHEIRLLSLLLVVEGPNFLYFLLQLVGEDAPHFPPHFVQRIDEVLDQTAIVVLQVRFLLADTLQVVFVVQRDAPQVLLLDRLRAHH